MAPPDEAAVEAVPRPSALNWRLLPWALSAALFVAAALIPLPAGLSRPGAYTLAALGSAVLFWASGVEDPAFVGLLIVTLLSLLGVLSFTQAVAGFGTEFVWLLAATFIIAQAMADTGLGRRIALRILYMAGGRPSRVLLALILVVIVLSFMVPTATGRISILLPVCLGIIEASGLHPGSSFARAMLVGTSHASIVAGTGVVTAAGATIYAAGAFDRLIGVRWSYPAWLAAFFPLVLLFEVVLWRLLLRIFPPERADLGGGAAYVREELRHIGPLTQAEAKMLAIFLGIFLLWIVGPRWKITTAQAGTIGMLLTLLPGIRLVLWERAMAAIRWNVVILFAVSLALAGALESSGAAAWLTSSVLGLVARPSPLALVALFAPLIALIRIGFVNNLGMTALALPLAFTLAKGWMISPAWAGMIVVMAAGPGFLLPTQTPTGMITMGYEYYTIRDYLRSGIPASIALLLLIGIAALFYWPRLGYAP